MKPPFRVIDADGHVTEHTVDWAAHLPARFRKDAPFWTALPDGERVFIVERKVWPTRRDYYGSGPEATAPVAVGPWAEVRKSGHLWNLEREGQWDPAKRLLDMDEEGIDIAVLFGSYVGLCIGSIEHPEFATALSEAYNDWLEEYCAYERSRLKGIALLPLQDPQAARAELRRVVQQKGMVGGLALPNLHGHLLHEPQFDPIWEEAQALDVPICVHFTSTNSPGLERFDRFALKHAFAPLGVMMAVGSFVAGGVLERFPRLRVAFLEAGAGWVPWVMDRLHEHWELLPQQLPWQRRDPMEIMRGDQCHFSFEVDEMTIPYVVDLVGGDRLLYASDYSHWDCMCPESVKRVLGRGDISDEVKQKILGENAARLFKI